MSLKSHQIPYPLPTADGGLCGLEVTSLEWTPGQISGVIASECIAETRQEVDLPVYGGHFSRNVPALLDASVTRITGTVNVAAGTHRTSESFVADGQTRFTLPVANRRAVHGLEITADLTATLNVPLPPMLQTTHHPARTDVYTRRVTCRCGESSTTRTVRIYVHHPEHVRAVETQRAPVTRTRPESIALAAGVGADAPFESLHVPPPQATAAQGGADPGWRFQLVELAMAWRLAGLLPATGAALASIAAAPDDANAEMVRAFDAVLTGMAYAGVGLCLFAIVWAGFVLMAEGAEGQKGPGRGKARNAVIMAVVGLVVVLLAKAIAARH